jgi:hypothetical protein
MSIRNLAYSAALILCLAIPSANSAVITMEFDGFVNEVRPIFAPLVSLGDEMTATFSFDPSSVTESFTHNSGERSHILSVLDYRVSMGDVIATGSGGRGDVRYNVGSRGDRIVFGNFDSQAVSAPALEELHDINRVFVGAVLYPITGYLNSSELPSSISTDSLNIPPGYVTIQMEVAGGDFEWQPMFASISNARIFSVPAPATMMLFGLGLFGLRLVSKKAKRAA